MKKLVVPVILIILMLASALAPSAAALVAQSEDYFVTDDANVLTDVTKEDIISFNRDLEAQCGGAQIFVVTIKYLTDGLDAEQYATKLFNDWGVGDQQANNGMLLLLVTEEYRGGIVAGAGINGAFTTELSEKYLNTYFWDYVDAREYDKGVRSILNVLSDWYADYYGVNNNVNQGGGYNEQPARDDSYWGDLVAFIVIFLIVVAIIIFAAVGSDRSRHRAYYVHHGIPRPRYHFWYMWRPGPYRPWYRTHHHNQWRGGPRGPRGPGGSGGPPRSGGGGSSFGGRSGGNGRSGGGFGGFGGGGRSGGGFGGSGGGGGFRGGGGGGGRSGGFGGRK